LNDEFLSLRIDLLSDEHARKPIINLEELRECDHIRYIEKM
jgi:hypothetical protein